MLPDPQSPERSLGEFFDRCARQGLMYDFEPAEREKLGRFLAAWGIEPGFRVLEPGCGAGRLTAILADAVGGAGEVIACDLSPEMIARARERGLPPQAHFVNSSVSAIERPDGWFDRVICLNVFPHFADKAAVLGAFHRLLREDGQLWINHFRGRDDLNRFHREAAPEVASHVLPCPLTMRRMLEENGFVPTELADGEGGYELKALKMPRATPLDSIPCGA